jgi:hypothetical protein
MKWIGKKLQNVRNPCLLREGYCMFNLLRFNGSISLEYAVLHIDHLKTSESLYKASCIISIQNTTNCI